MKKHPATSSATRRSRGSALITGERVRGRSRQARRPDLDPQLEFAGAQRGRGEAEEVGVAAGTWSTLIDVAPSPGFSFHEYAHGSVDAVYAGDPAARIETGSFTGDDRP